MVGCLSSLSIPSRGTKTAHREERWRSALACFLWKLTEMQESAALRRPHTPVCACVEKGHKNVLGTLCTPLKKVADMLFEMLLTTTPLNNSVTQHMYVHVEFHRSWFKVDCQLQSFSHFFKLFRFILFVSNSIESKATLVLSTYLSLIIIQVYIFVLNKHHICSCVSVQVIQCECTSPKSTQPLLSAFINTEHSFNVPCHGLYI